jgi:aminomuconate-semialdehyde/2-hydroxymuconate-6-semialdehyde dehydrogenase
MLALADSTDMGKPVSDARIRDVPRTAANYRFFADHARLATGDVLPMDTGHPAYTRFEPAGVVAAVAPWDFPLMLESWKVAPAGLTGALQEGPFVPGRHRSRRRHRPHRRSR